MQRKTIRQFIECFLVTDYLSRMQHYLFSSFSCFPIVQQECAQHNGNFDEFFIIWISHFVKRKECAFIFTILPWSDEFYYNCTRIWNNSKILQNYRCVWASWAVAGGIDRLLLSKEIRKGHWHPLPQYAWQLMGLCY